MASSPTLHPEHNPNQSQDSKSQKRKKIESKSQVHKTTFGKTKWKTLLEHRNYSSKLVEALSSTNRQGSVSTGGAIRQAADRVLAVAAKGRTRWSRAILSSCGLNCKRKKVRMSTNNIIRSIKTKGHKKSPLERKERVLGRLVPGCRKLSFPSLLEETTDYIAALEMQVRAMAALASILTSGQTSAAAS